MGPKKERKASLPSATEVKSMTGTETGRVSATKREKRTSQSSVTEMRSSIIQGIEAPNAASVCSFTLNFSAFCVEELADYIPQVNIIGIKRLSHQALLEKISEGSVSEFEKTCEENQPAVQILYENLEKLENLRMIVFKNMMVESGIIRAVGRCLSLYPTITTLKFENCSLSAFDVELIANILHEASSVIDLSLNENEIPQMNYYLLLQDTNLQHLSLCQCAINDEGARYLSNELGFRDQRTQTLLTLNLTHNQITCDGMQFIANALRTNRTLVSLSLAGNRISDRGATYLAEVLTKFPLWHQECVERRCRNLIELLKRKSLIEEQMKQSKNSDESNVKLESKRSLTPKKSKSATKDRKKASRGKVTSDSVTKENISNEFTVTPSAVTPSRNSAEMQKNEQSVDHSLEEDMHPYMQEVKPEDGALWCAGNFQLAHINLAYNRIGLIGTIAFHGVVIYQDKLLKDTRRGLLRLVLQGNPIPEACPELRELLEITNNRYYSITEKVIEDDPSNERISKPSSGSLKRRSGSKQSFRKSSTGGVK